jgi:amphi-Trp domain-containing protein
LKIDFIYLANKINEQPMSERDIEKVYSKDEFIAKLRRLADAIEQNENFRISVAGEAIYVPDRATFSIEHERGDGEHEIEFQIKWQDQ